MLAPLRLSSVFYMSDSRHYRTDIALTGDRHINLADFMLFSTCD